MQNFRTDIEGLRAVAVLLVMLYHFGVPGIPGGFVGVDVFFVISGFVITQLLQRAFASGSFRFRDFYARRIRRLVPVFLLVSTVSFLLISPFYLDEDYYVFAKSWLASLIGFSNFYYYAELSQYFAPEAKSLTLLHTWSLAVEEQFYLLWPLTLFAAYKFFPGKRGWPVFLLLWCAAFALSVYMAEHAAKAAYYLLPARAYELMLGAGIALYARELPRLSLPVAQMLAAVGLTLVVATALLLPNSAHFPGYNALWPTLGTALMLYAGQQHTNTLVARTLSVPVMVWIGGLSYSMYLWHWPPVALLHYQLVELDAYWRIGLFAAVIALSWFSHRFVENRFRYLPWGFKKSFLVFVLVPMIAIWLVQSTIRIADDLSFRIPADKREIYKTIALNNSADLYKPCFKGDPAAFDQSARCILGVKDGRPNAVFIGDSHATAMTGFLEQFLQDTELSVLLINRASTPFVAPERAKSLFADDPTKIARTEAIAAYLSAEPMTVFVGAWWTSYLANPAYEQHFLEALDWLLQRGHQVIVVEDAPMLPSASYAYCQLKNKPDCSLPWPAVAQAQQPFIVFKQKAEQQFPAVQWIDPLPIICDEQRCNTVIDGTPLYRDENHLNYIGSALVGKLYKARFGNPLSLRYGKPNSDKPVSTTGNPAASESSGSASQASPNTP